MLHRILCCIAACFIVTICHAQNFWQLTSGPQDYEIRSLVTDSSGTIYQTADDAFRSTDDGRSWTMTGHPIWTSRADLAGGNAKGTVYTLFANGYPEGLLVSTNQGVNWTRLVTTPGPTPEEDRTIHALAVKSDSIAFLCTHGNVTRYTLSTQNWDSIPIVEGGSTQAANKVMSFAIARNGAVFAATLAGVYRTTDDGDHWLAAMNGIDSQAVRFITSAGDGELFAAGETQLFHSTDAGEHWEATSLDLSYKGSATIATKGENFVFVGTRNGAFFRSTDGGDTWEQHDVPGMYPHPILVTRTGTLLVGSTINGIFRSTDDGLTWEISNSGITSADINEIVVAPNGRIHAVGNSYGSGASVWTSSDRGKTWPQVRLDGVPTCSDYALLALPNNHILVGTGCGGIQRTTDDGATWRDQSSGLETRLVYALELLHNGDILAGTAHGLYRSIDTGAHWERAGFGDLRVRSLLVHPDGTIIKAESETWNSPGSLSYSTDNGETWEVSPDITTPAPVTGMTVASDGSIYAGCDAEGDVGIFRSTDRGRTWKGTAKLGKKLIGNKNMEMSFVADKAGNVYLTFSTDYVFRTTNRGGSWERINSGFPIGSANGIALDSLGYLWAGSSIGVVRSITPTPAPLTVGQQTTGDGVASFEIQTYPNPAAGNMIFSFALQQAGEVQLKLYDLLGTEIAVVADLRMEAGRHQIPFSVQGLPPGTYHYILKVDNRTATRKLVVWR